MDPSEYELMFRVESGHWWYGGMAAILKTLLDRFYPKAGSLRVLDAGCGTGGTTAGLLARYGRVVGIDREPLALGFSRRRGLRRLARASVDRLPFAPNSFDLVASLDVLYERDVPSDARALAEARRVLLRGGRLLLRLPAFEWMRRGHDEIVHTRHRYTATEVRRLLREEGFDVERLTYANTLLFPAAAARRLAERILRRKARSDLEWNAGRWNNALRAVLSLEAPLAAGTGLPFGLSVIAVGRKA